MFDAVDRDVRSIKMPGWGRVAPVDDVVGWLVFDPDSAVVEPIRRFLVDFVARGSRGGSVRSYAYVLLRWWRWLRAVGVEWDKATPAEARDLVLWLQQATKQRRAPRTVSAVTAGAVNAVTRKRHLGDGYEARTIRHNNAVVRSFYEFWIDRGGGPLINPVRLDRQYRRPHAHHNPLEPFRSEGKIRYNPKLPKAKPRAMPDVCIRCPSLRLDPAARPRLIAIIANLKERIAEARLNGWLGEVQGLQISLDAAANKLANLKRLHNQRRTDPISLGIPIIADP